MWVGLAVLAGVVTACGGGHSRPNAQGQGTPLIASDTWTPPVVTGPASAANFCTLLVATYQHVGQLPEAANSQVRQQMVRDYVDVTPRTIAAAPRPIAPAARLYLNAVAQILADLNQVGLNAQKLPRGQLGPLLLDPKIKAAGTKVIAYSQQYCHYPIGG